MDRGLGSTLELSAFSTIVTWRKMWCTEHYFPRMTQEQLRRGTKREKRYFEGSVGTTHVLQKQLRFSDASNKIKSGTTNQSGVYLPGSNLHWKWPMAPQPKTLTTLRHFWLSPVGRGQDATKHGVVQGKGTGKSGHKHQQYWNWKTVVMHSVFFIEQGLLLAAASFLKQMITLLSFI